MSAISRLQASFISGTQEMTLALANLNLDFSFVKIEAPTEYRQLGVALAKSRRSAAEVGEAHATARRLGSLFQSILPDTPNLIKAYGLRASQIAENPEVNPKGSKDDGPFQDYIGVDGTSIWAAATSSSAAIAAHLLACMLATLWPADKAVAIWVELVKERKRLLEEMIFTSNSFRIEDVAASQMSLSQEQLAMWDSSARAWLKAAEDAPFVKSRQQNLRTVVRDVNAMVSAEQDLYSSVTEAWRRALSTFEAIICGASFDISDGSVILALLSWHLYPNIVILTTKPRNILQNDDLIRGGQVIIGLSRQDQSPPGVHWCLSLNHLSYYGASQQITQSIALGDPQQNRLTLSDFTLVLLGGFVGLWSREEKIETSLALEIIGRVISMVKKGLGAEGNRFSNADSKMVFDHLADAMSRRQTQSQVDNGLSTKLIELGIRYQRFLKPSRVLAEFSTALRQKMCSDFRLFGMNDLYFGAALAQQDDRLDYIRHITREMVGTRQDGSTPPPCFLLVFKNADDKEKRSYFYWGRATDDFEISSREIEVELKTLILLEWDTGAEFQHGLDHASISSSNEKPFLSTLLWERPPRSIKGALTLLSIARARDAALKRYRGWIFDCVLQSEDREILLFRGRTTLGTARSQVHSFADRTRATRAINIPRNSTEHIFSYLRSNKLCPIRFSGLFCSTGFYNSYLATLSSLFRTYQGLSGATISPDILKCGTPLWGLLTFDNRYAFRSLNDDGELPTHIIPIETATASLRQQERLTALQTEYSDRSLRSYLSYFNRKKPKYDMERQPNIGSLYGFLDEDSLTGSLAIIAMLEVGQDLMARMEPHLIAEIFAISVDDSLYIASPMLGDPALGFGSPPEIRRVRGNIGRPGLNFLGFLASPEAVKAREKEPGMWNVINHHEFDGRLDDCFSQTTLHLGLTGYVHEIATGGSRFPKVSFAEAVVSCHNAGQWVADLDVFNVSLISRLVLVTAKKDCPGSDGAGKVPGRQLVTIENWEELLDPPHTPAVFRAHGNWQARLAAVLICLQKGYLTLLFGSHGCWNCAFERLAEEMESPRDRSGSRPPSPARPEGHESRRSTAPPSAPEQANGISSEDQEAHSQEPLEEDSNSSQNEVNFVEEGTEAKETDILSEGSSQSDIDVGGPNGSGDEGARSVEPSSEMGEAAAEPQDSGPRPVIFII